MQDLVE